MKVKCRMCTVLLVVFLVIIATLAVGAESRSPEVLDWLKFVKQRYSGTTITILLPSHPSTDALRKLAPEFEAATGIQTRWLAVEEEYLIEKILLEHSGGGTNFDIIANCVETNAEFVTKGVVEELSPYLNNPALTPDWFDYEDIVEAYRSLAVYDGGIYGIPLGGETVFVYYRKDLLEQYDKKPPQSFDDVLDLARFFHKRDTDGDGKSDIYGICFRARRGWEFVYAWSNFIFPFGGRIIDENGRPNLDTPGNVRSLEYMKELSEFGYPGMESFSFPEAWQAIWNGEVALAIEGSLAAVGAEDPSRSRVVGKMGYSKMPTGPEGAHAGVWGWTTSISPGSKNKEAAWSFLVWAFSRYNDARFREYGGGEQRVSVLDDPALQAKHPYYKAILETLEQASHSLKQGFSLSPQIVEWMGMVDIMGTYSSRAFIGEITPQEACNTMQAETMRLFK